jgi:mannose-1-phosphate guanylyltransferase
MTQEIKEAIILLGGDIKASFGELNQIKSLLDFGNYRLIDYQLSWLIKNGFNHVILAGNREYGLPIGFSEYIDWSIEPYPKGTGGAVMSAIDKLKSNSFYLMNIDDICMYNPTTLTYPDTKARILAAKPRVPYGKLELRQDIVIGFKEKPLTDYYVSAGHYYFKKHIVESYFPDNGNLEDKVLSELTKDRILENSRLSGKWISINTYRDYCEAKEMLSVKS